MSSQAENVPLRHKFVVYAPDMSDDGAFQRRLSVRQAHLDNAAEQAKQGIVKLGGAMLTPQSIAPNAEKKMVGSLFICEADSLETVRSLMESDIYYTSGVWDKEKLVVLPIALANLPSSE
ncbi:hypothetical protein BD311DRAFT_775874 [Dichomitus squalens]|uniref:YCII-related domain-containing protein n=1 Tax=Dichomitus squalens TaxID=114155 RepID=A0A4Q9MVC4_9APHY|nr:hypothetical protein BD311DRAFT_775874 [Dichomitus squalens]